MELNLDTKELAKSIVNEYKGFWKRNKVWLIIIFCLTITTIVSTGFAIYYGKTSSIEHAKILNAKIDELEKYGNKLESNLQSALQNLANAEQQTNLLEENKQQTLLIIEKQDDNIKEMNIELLLQANSISSLRESITLLGNFALNQIKINKQMKETLGRN